MPLPIESLKTAQVDTSKNQYLKPLWGAVNAYNASRGIGRVAAQSKRFDEFRKTGKLPARLDSEQRQRALALQDIMFFAASFLTCKPPNPDKQKRHPRWDAMTQLMADVTREAEKVGVKLVESPNDFRTINVVSKDRREDILNASVWLEVVDPKHREYNSLSYGYASWMKDATAQSRNQSFWEYMGEQDIDDKVLYDKGAKFLAEKNPRGNFAEIQGEKIDTTSCKSLQLNGGSNFGWGIFAVTTDGGLHIGAHSNDDGALVRHTSLTGGEPIMAAGEICIVKGKIVAISNLTGHYKLGARQFFNWLATTPLVEPDVIVKTRVGVSGVRNEIDERDPDVVIPIKAEDCAIFAATAGEVRQWIAKGRPHDDGPFDDDKTVFKSRVKEASWNDLKSPALDEVTAIEV